MKVRNKTQNLTQCRVYLISASYFSIQCRSPKFRNLVIVVLKEILHDTHEQDWVTMLDNWSQARFYSTVKAHLSTVIT